MLKDKGSQLSGENVSLSAHLQDALVRDKVSGQSPAEKQSVLRPMSELPFAARRPSHSAVGIDHDDQDYLNLNEMSSDTLNKWPQSLVQQSPNPPPPSSEQYMNLNAFSVAQADPKLLSRQLSTPAVHENEHLLRQSLERQHPSSLSPTSTSTSSSTLTSSRLIAQVNGAVSYSESEQLATRTKRASPPAHTNKRRSDAQRVPTSRPPNSTRQALPSQSNANESHVTYTELAEMAPRSAERTPKPSLVTPAGSPQQQQPQPQQQSSRRESRSQSSQAKSHVMQEVSLLSPQLYSYQQPSPSENHVALQAAPAVSSSSSPPPAATAPSASHSPDAVEYTQISTDKTQALIVVARQRNERMQQQRRPPGQLARAAPDASGISGSKTQLERKAAASNKSAAKNATGARGNSDAASIGLPAARPVHHNGAPLRSLIGGLLFRSARNSQSCE